MSTNNIALQTANADARDQNIRFYARGHKYEIVTDIRSKYTSVTTWNKSHFPKFDADAVIANIMRGKNWNPDNKYWGQTPEQIKASWFSNGASVADAGTNLHEQIEEFMNSNELVSGYNHQKLLENYRLVEEDSVVRGPEWQFFLKFVEDHPEMKPFRTEWMIYHEDLKIAGSVDMVYRNPDGTLLIYDWKRGKEIVKTNAYGSTATTECVRHLPDTNFWHYALQLNTYKTIIEEKYGAKVVGLCLVCLHPDNTNGSYQIIEVPFLEKEISELFDYRRTMISTLHRLRSPKSVAEFWRSRPASGATNWRPGLQGRRALRRSLPDACSRSMKKPLSYGRK